jgi:hypothetical protein
MQLHESGHRHGLTRYCSSMKLPGSLIATPLYLLADAYASEVVNKNVGFHEDLHSLRRQRASLGMDAGGVAHLHLPTFTQKIAQKDERGVAIALQLGHTLLTNRAVKILELPEGYRRDFHHDAPSIGKRADASHVPQPFQPVESGGHRTRTQLGGGSQLAGSHRSVEGEQTQASLIGPIDAHVLRDGLIHERSRILKLGNLPSNTGYQFLVVFF